MEERKMILKMIDEGKITAEEGVKLLETLEKTETRQADKPAELTTRVNWEEGNRTQSGYRQSSGASKITAFIESALQKIKEFDLDFNFGTYTNVHHIFHHRNLKETAIDISLENGSVTIVPWDEEDVRVECEAKVYRARDAQDAKEMFLREVSVSGDGEKLKFFSKVKSIKVKATVYLPQLQYRSINLYTFNGHLKGEKIHSEKLDLKAVNGSISFLQASGTKLNAETVNGTIEIKESTVHTCDVQSVNGTIDIDGVFNDADVETVNGTVHYHLKQTKDDPSYANIKATTGSVDIIVPYSIRIDGKLKTNVGGFTCNLDELKIIEEKKDFVQKQVVFVANEEKSPRLKLEASTNTGSVSVKQNGS